MGRHHFRLQELPAEEDDLRWRRLKWLRTVRMHERSRITVGRIAAGALHNRRRCKAALRERGRPGGAQDRTESAREGQGVVGSLWRWSFERP
jgi:hypothetical protein